MRIYNVTMDDLGATANTGRKMVLDFLVENEYITFEEHEYLSLNYAIIVKAPNYFSKLWKKVKGIKKEIPGQEIYMIVKQETLDKDLIKSTPEKNTPIKLVSKKTEE